MLSKKIEKLLVDQVNAELYSGYLYLHMADFYAEKGLMGFASWFKKQAEEEVEHGLKIRDYLHQENSVLPLAPIAAPEGDFKELKEPLLLQLAHEKKVTALINVIYKAAREEGDYRTERFLDWFIDEQVEEEENALALIEKFELLGKEGQGLYLLDKELGKRE